MDHGHADVAFRIVTKTTFPGWGHWISQGATTLWERWEGIDSRNHTMFGDISAWMFRSLAGLQPDADRPGFGRVLIRPHPVTGLEWAEGEHDSPHGRIRSAWRREGEGITCEVDVPPNVTAWVDLPGQDPARMTEAGDTLEDAADIRVLGLVDDRLRVAIGSGTYRFVIDVRPDGV